MNFTKYSWLISWLLVSSSFIQLSTFAFDTNTYRIMESDLQNYNHLNQHRALATVPYKNVCVCSEIGSKTECEDFGCTWETLNGVSACRIKLCSEKKNCIYNIDCAMINDTCTKLTQCSDYSIPKNGDCSTLNYQCVNGSEKCQAMPTPTSCSSQSLTKCYGVQTDGKVCYPPTMDSCRAYDMSSCSTITNSSLCNILCQWSNSACIAKTCASITQSSKCKFVYSNDFKSITFCQYVGNTCTEAKDVSVFTQSNCLKNTGNLYRWKDNKCQACEGSTSTSTSNSTSSNSTDTTSSKSYILAEFIVLIVLILI